MDMKKNPLNQTKISINHDEDDETTNSIKISTDVFLSRRENDMLFSWDHQHVLKSFTLGIQQCAVAK